MKSQRKHKMPPSPWHRNFNLVSLIYGERRHILQTQETSSFSSLFLHVAACIVPLYVNQQHPAKQEAWMCCKCASKNYQMIKCEAGQFLPIETRSIIILMKVERGKLGSFFSFPSWIFSSKFMKKCFSVGPEYFTWLEHVLTLQQFRTEMLQLFCRGNYS